MVDIARGDIFWVGLDEPAGSGPGFRRPVVIIQGDAANRSALATVICIPLTSNLKWADAPGNVLIPARMSHLAKDSVANVSQIVAIDRQLFGKKVGRIPRRTLELILNGLDLILGR